MGYIRTRCGAQFFCSCRPCWASSRGCSRSCSSGSIDGHSTLVLGCRGRRRCPLPERRHDTSGHLGDRRGEGSSPRVTRPWAPLRVARRRGGRGAHPVVASLLPCLTVSNIRSHESLSVTSPVVAVLDSHAVDPMVDDADARGIIERARDEGRVRLLYTHVTMDELVATPDLGRRRDSLTRSRPSQRRCQRGPSSSTCHASGKQGSARTQKPSRP